MRVALDTNILAYAEGIDGPDRQQHAWDILQNLDSTELFVPVQVLGELFNVLLKKGNRDRIAARDAVLAWRESYTTIDIEENVTVAALDLSARHAFGIWDAIIVSAAVQSGCQVLLSEDMQHGSVWSGLTIINPFSIRSHPLIAAYIDR